ncbi:MAG: hypothetical protein M3O01_06000 [Pseudomonadota bacterium]|nr:hypothetical protein [Pseudomonadota bacterium]
MIEIEPTRSVMTLRAQGIRDSDMTRLAAFLRIGSDRLRMRWELVCGDDADVVLLGDDETLPMDQLGTTDRDRAELRLVDAGHLDPGAGQLCRPLTFDALVDQLALLEARDWSRGSSVPRRVLPRPVVAPGAEVRAVREAATATAPVRAPAKGVMPAGAPVRRREAPRPVEPPRPGADGGVLSRLRGRLGLR